MKIYVMTDLEGVAGVSRWDQTGTDTPGYPQAVRLFMEELRACVAGIQAADPSAEIWVWDGHGPGAVDVERFPRGARLLARGPISAPYYLDSTFDAVFFLAQHAKAGTRDANLAHTYSSANVEYYKINGVEYGEFGCRAAMAGAMGVPTVFVSGDDKMMAEARELVPGIYGAQVKVGLALQLALHMAPEDARDLIRDTARAATLGAKEIAPFVIEPPYTQEIMIWGRTDSTGFAQAGFAQTGTRTFVKSADRLELLKV